MRGTASLLLDTDILYQVPKLISAATAPARTWESGVERFVSRSTFLVTFLTVLGKWSPLIKFDLQHHKTTVLEALGSTWGDDSRAIGDRAGCLYD